MGSQNTKPTQIQTPNTVSNGENLTPPDDTRTIVCARPDAVGAVSVVRAAKKKHAIAKSNLLDGNQTVFWGTWRKVSLDARNNLPITKVSRNAASGAEVRKVVFKRRPEMCVYVSKGCLIGLSKLVPHYVLGSKLWGGLVEPHNNAYLGQGRRSRPARARTIPVITTYKPWHIQPSSDAVD